MANSVLREVESHYMQSIVDSVRLPIHQINTTENAPKKIYKVYNFSVLTVEQMFSNTDELLMHETFFF